MEERAMKFASAATPSLLIFEVPGLIAASGEDTATHALPLVGRQGGLLLAFLVGVTDEEAFPGPTADEDQMVGPAKTFEGIELYEEEDAGSGAIQAARTGVSCSVTVCGFLDSVLAYLREYDPVTDSLLEVVPFDEMHPADVPLHAEVLAPALEWARGELEGRVLFFSARGEQEVPEVNAAATPKKAAAKRISNAALAEQVSPISPDEGAYEAAGHGRQWAISKTPGMPSRAASCEPRPSPSGFGIGRPVEVRVAAGSTHAPRGAIPRSGGRVATRFSGGSHITAVGSTLH